MSNYRPFPDVADWPKGEIDFSPIDSLKQVTDRLAEEPPDVLQRARDVVKRLAAIETGAIEKLYDVDRGFTITAALDSAVLESLRKSSDAAKHALIESQLAAYDSVLDFVTGRQPLAEAWIRELHALLCRSQDTYTAIGANSEPQTLPLEPGSYKTRDNHVQTRNGIHYYAPVIETVPEMARLVTNINSTAYSNMHSVDQAAYIHYALVAVHPFADGNGRVARALTSIPTYRAFRLPILITVDHRESYFDVLEAADNGQFHAFRIFITDRVVDSIVLLEQSIGRAKGATPEEVANSIAQNFVTRGDFSHVAIDQAADGLLSFLLEHLKALVNNDAVRPAGLQWSISVTQTHRDAQSSMHRRVLSLPERMVHLHGASIAPAEANSTVQIGVEVPLDAAPDDFFLMECGAGSQGPRLEIPVRDVLPRRFMTVEMRLTMFAEEAFGFVGRALEQAGRKALHDQGYVRKEK